MCPTNNDEVIRMPISSIAAIKTYFEKQPHGREVSIPELKQLRNDQIGFEEIALLCAVALGEILEEKKGNTN